jgi:hypothetical protein
LVDVSDVLTAFIIRAIALMIEAVSTFETSVSLYHNILRKAPEEFIAMLFAVRT